MQEEEEEDEKISLSTLECVPGPLRKERVEGKEGKGPFLRHSLKAGSGRGRGFILCVPTKKRQKTKSAFATILQLQISGSHPRTLAILPSPWWTLALAATGPN